MRDTELIKRNFIFVPDRKEGSVDVQVWLAGDLHAREASDTGALESSRLKICRSFWTHPVSPETRAANVARSSSLAITVLLSAKISASLPLSPTSPVMPQE